ncbi:MAG: sigma-70 family RNA polymerase sigma factor [Oscillospiraceae bacterium]|jgi:RNA polymerase sigma-70 factor (ECF subfamily)|nr:sigma-70 family RNA polymerase sigma factor [Oscillospiraceae bacterium]
MDDSAILELFRQRSEDAVDACSERFGAYCRKIAMNVLGSYEDAQECVNETWLSAWNAIPPAKPTLLRAFLGKITRNIAINRYNAAHAQKRGAALALDELAEIPAIAADEGEITRVINDFLRSEQQIYCNIFVQRYWYVQSVKEIAAQYRFSENKVASLLLRMRKRLRAKLEKEDLL